MSKNTRITVLIYLLTACTVPLQFTFKAYLTSNIGLTQAGIFFGMFSLMALTGIYTDLGFRELMISFIPKYESNHQDGKIRGLIRTSFFMQSTIALISFGVIYVLQKQIFTYICHTGCNYTFDQLSSAIIRFGIFQFVNSVSNIFETIVLAQSKSWISKICDIIRLGGYSILIVLFLQSNNLTIESLSQSMYIIPLIVIIYLIAYLGSQNKPLFFGKIDRTFMQNIKENIIQTFLITLAMGLYALIDIILVQRLSGGGNSALYTNAILLTNGFVFVIASAAPFIGSKISYFKHSSTKEEMSDFLGKILTIIIMLVALGRGGLMSILPIATTLIYGKLATHIYHIAFILGIGSFFGASLQFLMTITSGLGFYKNKIKAMRIGVGILTICGFLISKVISGEYAIAISSLLGQIGIVIILIHSIQKNYGTLSRNYRDIITTCFVGLLGGILGALLWYLKINNIFTYMSYISAYIIICICFIMYSFKGLKQRYGTIFFGR